MFSKKEKTYSVLRNLNKPAFVVVQHYDGSQQVTERMDLHAEMNILFYNLVDGREKMGGERDRKKK